MKKILFLAPVVLALSACSTDGVSIDLPSGYSESTVVVSHLTIDNIFSARSAEDLKINYDTLQVKDNRARMKLSAAGASRYTILSPVPSRTEPDFYAAPGENIKVTIKSFEPLDYSVQGTPLMEDLTALNSITGPIQKEYMKLVEGGNITEAQAHAMMDRYDAAIKGFVAAHPDSPAIPFAIIDLSGDDFKTAYDAMTPEARKSILMPFADAYNAEVENMQAERNAEQERAAVYASGSIDAANFTLPDLAGKMVSLSDFRGKYVVLDFWGSWCGWCIKGFPALKDAYAKYGDKIAVIGIDCNDSEAAWRAAVKQYELPWINVYNGAKTDLYEAYNVQGFPTKVTVNPQGKIVDVTTGEDPSFFTRLAQFVR